MIKRILAQLSWNDGASSGSLLTGRVLQSISLSAALLLLTFGCRSGDRPTGPDVRGDNTTSVLITNLEPAAYEKDTLEVGDSVYVDRDYTIDGVPSGYGGWRYVRTANDDKASTSDSAVGFTLTDTARVALAYDVRTTTLPDWLSDWTTTGDTLRTSDVDHLVYTRVFAPGDVVLGGNLSGGAEGAASMYLLSATRSSSEPHEGSGGDTTTATGALLASMSTTGDSVDSDGYRASVDGNSEQAVGINDSITFVGLATGDHNVALSDVDSNCSISGSNPRTVSVTENDTVSTSFDISCKATGGSNSNAEPVWTDDFESGVFGGTTSDGYGWRHSSNNNIQVNQENPHSGSYSAMVRFPDGGSLTSSGEWPDGTGAINEKLKYRVPDLTEFWMEFHVYVPDNYVHPEVVNSSDNRKFWAIWDIGRDDNLQEDPHVHLFNELIDGSDSQTPNRTSKGRYFIQTKNEGSSTNWYTDGSGNGCGDGTCIGDLLNVGDRGTWVRLRYHVKLSSDFGAEDGAWHAWKDDQLIMAHTGLDWEPPKDGNYWFRKGQILGAQNSPYPQETTFYFDDFKIWVDDPGW